MIIDINKCQGCFNCVVPLHPEYSTNPRVFYIGLPRMFLAGSVVSANNECLKGADVSITEVTSGTPLKKKTDGFGDFEFEGLDNGKVYSVRVEAAGHSTMKIDDIKLTNDSPQLKERQYSGGNRVRRRAPLMRRASPGAWHALAHPTEFLFD